MPLPRVRILKQGTSTYVASFAVGTDADVIAMISALIRTLQNNPDEEIHIHTALPEDTLLSFVLSGGEASVLFVRSVCVCLHIPTLTHTLEQQVRRSSGRCELSFYRENEMLRKSDLDAISAAYVVMFEKKCQSFHLFMFQLRSYP